MSAARLAAIEPVTPEPVRTVRRAVMTQWWINVAFLHWAVEPQVVAPFLPRGTEPDVIGGRTYVGLVAFRMHRTGLLGSPAVPWLGSFPETNVRIYSVDGAGRRGVVFLSMDASRLVPALAGRTALRLPYVWSRMVVRHGDGVVTYASRRRPPARTPVTSRIRIRIGEAVGEPSAAEHFMTARWGLHTAAFGRTLYLPAEHPRWPLQRAELLELRENVISATGLPAPAGRPDSVLYSPGVPVRFGTPV